MHSSSESECSDSDQQLSATHYDAKLPYTSDICLPFNSEKLASIAKNSIDADPEINPDRVHRYLSVENGDLIVTSKATSTTQCMYSSTPLHITTTPKRRPTATPSRNLTATFSTLSIATPGSTLRGIGRAPSFDPSNKLGTRPGDKGNGNLGGNLDYEDNNDSQEQQDINNLFTKLEDYDAPKITFHRDDRKLTADFIKHFDTLVDDLKKLIVERKEEYQRKIAQEKERERNIATEIDNLKKQHKHLTETFEEEIEKEKRYQDYIDEVSAKQVKSSQEVHELSEQVRQLKAELARRKEALAAKQDVVDGHRKMDRPELEFFEGALGLEIKGGSGENELVFAFTKVAKLNPQKAHIVTVDLSERAYKVSRCDPEIPEMDALVSQLNQTRDFYGFLKHVRKAFSNISGG